MVATANAEASSLSPAVAAWLRTAFEFGQGQFLLPDIARRIANATTVVANDATRKLLLTVVWRKANHAGRRK